MFHLWSSHTRFWELISVVGSATPDPACYFARCHLSPSPCARARHILSLLIICGETSISDHRKLLCTSAALCATARTIPLSSDRASPLPVCTGADSSLGKPLLYFCMCVFLNVFGFRIAPSPCPFTFPVCRHTKHASLFLHLHVLKKNNPSPTPSTLLQGSMEDFQALLIFPDCTTVVLLGPYRPGCHTALL